MAVYYKFKSARDYDSIPMDGPFISVGVLKERIFESKHLGRGTDFDLVVTNAQTNEEYPEEGTLIPKNTSVLIRRVPGRPRKPIITDQEPITEITLHDTPIENAPTPINFISNKFTDDNEWDEFGNDLYSVPEASPIISINTLPGAPPTNKAEEDNKIKALIETPALDWQRQGPDGFGPGRGFGRGVGGRLGARGFGPLGLERKTPPIGYVCHRCKVPGHFIQHCPTNGDPNYDIKRVKPPTGIPKSMLVQTPEGSYSLPCGAVAVLRPNEAAFEKEVEGLPSSKPLGDLPPELRCPLCNEVMRDAVLTSKCCFKSFCDKCIREYIISNLSCVCGVSNVLTDDLLPNKTLRDTISRILESGNSSTENLGTAFQLQDMESARSSKVKIPSPANSAGEERSLPAGDQGGAAKAADVSEATHEFAKEGAEEEGKSDGKKKKKKKMKGSDMGDGFVMPVGPAGFNPYWNGFDGYMPPFPGPFPMMGYGMGPMDMPFQGIMPDPFGGQGFIMPPPPPHRDFTEVPRPPMSREEFEGYKTDVRQRRENGRSDQDMSRDFGREVNASAETPSLKPKIVAMSSANQRQYRVGDRSPDRDRRGRNNQNFPPRHSIKRKLEHGSSSSFERERDREKDRARDRDRDHERDRVRDRDRDPERERERDILLEKGRERDSERERERDICSEKGRERERDSERERERDSERDRERDSGFEKGRDRERDRDKDRVRGREREGPRRHHYHRSQSLSKKPTAEVAQAKSVSDVAPADAADLEKKHKGSVFSRISFPEGESSSKKRKSGGCSPHQNVKPSSLTNTSANGHQEEEKLCVKEHVSSDEDKNFKRRASRSEDSPAPDKREIEADGNRPRSRNCKK